MAPAGRRGRFARRPLRFRCARRWGDVVRRRGDAVPGGDGRCDQCFRRWRRRCEASGGGVAGSCHAVLHRAMGMPRGGGGGAAAQHGTRWPHGVLAPADVVTGDLDTADAAEDESRRGRTARYWRCCPSLFVSDGGDVDSRDSPRRPRGARARWLRRWPRRSRRPRRPRRGLGAGARPMAARARDGARRFRRRADAKVTRVLVGASRGGTRRDGARARGAPRGACRGRARRARIAGLCALCRLIGHFDRGAPRKTADAFSVDARARSARANNPIRLDFDDAQGDILAGTSTDTPRWDAVTQRATGCGGCAGQIAACA